MARLTAAPRFLRVTEFLEMTGMSRSFIFAQMVEGAFPIIHLGPRTIALNKREVVLWMEDRMASKCSNFDSFAQVSNYGINKYPPPFKMFSKGLLILW